MDSREPLMYTWQPVPTAIAKDRKKAGFLGVCHPVGLMVFCEVTLQCDQVYLTQSLLRF